MGQIVREEASQLLDFGSLTNSLVKALEQEMEHTAKEGGTQHSLFGGQVLGHQRTECMCKFVVDEEIRIPDGTQISLKADDRTISGTLLGSEGFDVYVALETEPALDSAWTLSANPEFLLRELIARLKALEPTALTDETFRKAHATSLIHKRHTVRSLVEAALDRSVTFVWGPPGTGKTQFVAELANRLLDRGEKTLMMSVSNIAVDNASLRLRTLLPEKGDNRVLRFGHPIHPELVDDTNLVAHLAVESGHPDLIAERRALVRQRRELARGSDSSFAMAKRLQSLSEEIQTIKDLLRDEEHFTAASASVLLTTLAKASITRFVQQAATSPTKVYDTVILDEASTIFLPYILWSSGIAHKRLVIVGDFRQLPPVARSQSEHARRYLATDIFDYTEITHLVDKGQWDPRLHILSEQHRMAPAISALVNTSVYGGLLRDAPTVCIRQETGYFPVPEFPAVVVDTSGIGFCLRDQSRRSYSRFNILHAVVASALTKSIEDAEVAVATPYVLQGRLTNRVIRELNAANRVHSSTVHRLQGLEKPVIILDTVEADGPCRMGQLVHGGHGSTAMRLMNVAFTRARNKLIVLADKEWLVPRLAKDSILGDAIAKIPAVDVLGLPLNVENSIRVLEGEELNRHLELSLLTARESVKILADLDGTGRDPFIWALVESLSTVSGVLSRVDTEIGLHGGSADYVKSLTRKIQEHSPGTRVAKTYLKGVDVIVIDGRHAYLEFSRRTRETSARTGPVLARLLYVGLPETVQFLDSLLRIDATMSMGGLAEFLSSIRCPDCGARMKVVNGSYGYFMSCSKKRKYHKAIRIEPEWVQQYINEQTGADNTAEDYVCPECGSPMAARAGRNGVFLGCSAYPHCKHTEDLKNIL